MKASNKTRELTSREVADISQATTTRELGFEELSDASGGTCAGSAYKQVSLGLRKSAGGTASG